MVQNTLYYGDNLEVLREAGEPVMDQLEHTLEDVSRKLARLEKQQITPLTVPIRSGKLNINFVGATIGHSLLPPARRGGPMCPPLITLFNILVLGFKSNTL